MRINLTIIMIAVIFCTFMSACVSEEKQANTAVPDTGFSSVSADEELQAHYEDFLAFIAETTTEKELFESEKQRYNPDNEDLAWTNEISAVIRPEDGMIVLQVPIHTYYYGSIRIEAMDTAGMIIMNMTESPVYIRGTREYQAIPDAADLRIYSLRNDPLA
ncbi:MAG: hypothetical protein JXA44_14035 [Methanospirillaceae archaeon]|nr:hypothetical protein [Methanospirillaceae archaeon]